MGNERKEHKEMDVHNFQLNDIFHQNAKEYQTRPVIGHEDTLFSEIS